MVRVTRLWSVLTLTVLAPLAAAGVTVVKTANPAGPVAPGETIQYTVTISNPSNFDRAITSFYDLVPENTSYLSGSLTLSPFTPDSLWYHQGQIFNTGDLHLPANGSTTIRFRVQVGLAPPGGVIENTALTNFGASNTASNGLAAGPLLYAQLDVDPPGVVTPGELLTYTLTIINYGFGAAAGTQVLAPVPSLADFEPGSVQVTGATGIFGHHAPSDSVRTDAAGLAIAARRVATLQYAVRVDGSLPDDVQIDHTAQVDGIPTNTVTNFTATLSDYVDLTDVPGNVVVTDPSPFDLTGFALAGCDFDNDGKGDLVIGDHLGNDEGTRSGVVHIVYGGFGLSGQVTLPSGGAATTQIRPPQGTTWFGFSLAAGDFTGDGVDDLLIGAPGTQGAGPGQAFLVAGGGFAEVIDLEVTPPRSVISGAGLMALGWNGAAADFNGDGQVDLVSGAPNFQVAGEFRGLVVVIPGGPALPASISLGAAPAGTSAIIGDAADGGVANTPQSVAAGDVNGDGRDDLLLGAPFGDTAAGVDSGRLYVVFGSADPVGLDLSGDPQTGFHQVDSHFPQGQMGYSVTAGDVNGDGFAEMGIGAPQASWLLTPGDVLFSNAGVAFLVRGGTGAGRGSSTLDAFPGRVATIFGANSLDRLGWSCVMGDVNGDGFDDFLTGAPRGTNFSLERGGVAYLLLGSDFIQEQYLLPFAPTQVLQFFSDAGSEAAFTSVAMGDLNSDGYDDLFLGDVIFDPTAPGVTDGDETHVFLGRPRAPRLVFAVAGEFGNTDLALQAGEQLILQFDQAVDVQEGLLQSGDFFLTNGGATLGSQAQLRANPNDPTQVVITLGPGFGNLNISGVDPGTSTRLDVGSSIRPGLIRGRRNRLVAEDTGFINFDDRGVDIVWTLSGAATPVTPGAGGQVGVSDNADRNRPDFAYTRHGLNVPPGAIGSTTQFRIGRPPETLAGLDLRNAVTVRTSAPVTGFNQPVTLRLQYRDEDLVFTPGGVEALFRVYQVVNDTGADPLGLGGAPVRRLASGQTLRLVPGTQTIDTGSNTVTVTIDSLSPAGTSDTPGTFATIPVNPVEERLFHIGPSSGDTVTLQAGAVIQPGPAGAYTLHQIEIPGYTAVSPGAPGSTRVRLRAASLFERAHSTVPAANTFPVQSGAVFAVETQSAGGGPIAFAAPVNVRVQYIARTAPTDTDVCDFSGTPGQPALMRTVQSNYDLTNGTNFQYVDRPQTVNLGEGTVTVEGLTNLTGPSGVSLIGAVVDTRVTAITTERLIQYLLGQTALSLAERNGADRNSDGRVDAADLVRQINGP